MIGLGVIKEMKCRGSFRPPPSLNRVKYGMTLFIDTSIKGDTRRGRGAQSTPVPRLLTALKGKAD